MIELNIKLQPAAHFIRSQYKEGEKTYEGITCLLHLL
jgi:hypothetical protein